MQIQAVPRRIRQYSQGKFHADAVLATNLCMPWSGAQFGQVRAAIGKPVILGHFGAGRELPAPVWKFQRGVITAFGLRLIS